MSENSSNIDLENASRGPDPKDFAPEKSPERPPQKLLIPELASKRIVFVTGKGGVGKSTVSAALALRISKMGKRCLLAEIGDLSFYQNFFGLEQVSLKPTAIAENLDVVLWDADSCLREYVLHYLKVERLYNLFFENRVTKALINAAPALRELSLLGKITSGIRGIGAPVPYDCIVIDAYATGHSLALLRAPRGISDVIKIGPMGDQSRDIMKVLSNEDTTAYVIVTLAEELPTIESIELEESLLKEVGIHAHVICNRVLTPPLTLQELNFESVNQDKSANTFVSYLRAVLKRQNEHLARLRNKFSAVQVIPLWLGSSPGMDLIRKMGDVLR